MTVWVRRLHMYAGLLTFTALLVYGISGLDATFARAPAQRQQNALEPRFEPFTVPAGITDKQVADLVYEHLKLPLSNPVPPFAVRRNAENNLAFDFYTVNGRTRVTVLEKENRLRIEPVRVGFFRFVNNLHGTTVGAPSPDWRVSAWKYYNEVAVWSLSWMVLSGIYLWLATRPGHRIAAACFASGTLGFIVLYAITR